jgi:hypothetical protein
MGPHVFDDHRVMTFFRLPLGINMNFNLFQANIETNCSKIRYADSSKASVVSAVSKFSSEQKGCPQPEVKRLKKQICPSHFPALLQKAL